MHNPSRTGPLSNYCASRAPSGLERAFTPRDASFAVQSLHAQSADCIVDHELRIQRSLVCIPASHFGPGDSEMFTVLARPSARATAAAVAVALLVLGCGGGGGGTPTAPPPSGGTGGSGSSSSTDITVQNNSFSPASTTVPAGSTITWTWNSCTGDGYGGQMCTDHSVVFDDGGRNGSAVQSSGSFSSQFATAGTYNYHCSVHGTAMHGTIIVQ